MARDLLRCHWVAQKQREPKDPADGYATGSRPGGQSGLRGCQCVWDAPQPAGSSPGPGHLTDPSPTKGKSTLLPSVEAANWQAWLPTCTWALREARNRAGELKNSIRNAPVKAKPIDHRSLRRVPESREDISYKGLPVSGRQRYQGLKEG